MIPQNRPITPGEVLVREFLNPMNLTQTALAERLGMSPQELNPIVHGNRRITARLAILLSMALHTSPEFWLNLQNSVDVWDAYQKFI